MIEMSKKTNKNVEEKKVKINKGQLGVRIMAAFLAFLMLLSICGTVIYYIYSSIAA